MLDEELVHRWLINNQQPAALRKLLLSDTFLSIIGYAEKYNEQLYQAVSS